MELKRRREELGLTQEELARVVGISARTVQRHESGRSQSQAIKFLLEKELTRMEKRVVKE